MRLLYTISLCFLVFSVTSVGAAENDQFLATRHVISQVYFDADSIKLTKNAKRQLDIIGQDLQDIDPRQKLVRVEGFASPEGANDNNMKLSLLRAAVVKDYLSATNNLDVVLFVTGFGEKKASDGTMTEMRRVDIAIYNRNRAINALFDETGKIERFNLQ